LYVANDLRIVNHKFVYSNRSKLQIGPEGPEVRMSNVVEFPVARARSVPKTACEHESNAAGEPRRKSRGEILLFTGVRYMRHPAEAGGSAARLPAGSKSH
jgi:hypothetical protein